MHRLNGLTRTTRSPDTSSKSIASTTVFSTPTSRAHTLEPSTPLLAFRSCSYTNKNLARSGVSLTPDPHIGNKSHFSGFVRRETASTADDARPRASSPEKCSSGQAPAHSDQRTHTGPGSRGRGLKLEHFSGFVRRETASTADDARAHASSPGKCSSCCPPDAPETRVDPEGATADPRPPT